MIWLIITKRRLGGMGNLPLSSLTPSPFSYVGVQAMVYGPE